MGAVIFVPPMPNQTPESEVRRLKTKLSEIGDRSDLELAILYPKPEQAADAAELEEVEAEVRRRKERGV
jgi:hypothetical protein